MKENHRLEEAVKDGIHIPKDGYWGDVPSKICGEYGGNFDEDKIKEAEENFQNKTVKNE